MTYKYVISQMNELRDINLVVYCFVYYTQCTITLINFFSVLPTFVCVHETFVWNLCKLFFKACVRYFFKIHYTSDLIT